MAFSPSTRIHPGHVIARTLDREGMTQKNLSARTGLTEKHLSHIINGEASITIETALLLENALGGSAAFWVNLEKNHQEARARETRVEWQRKEAHLVELFPYGELVKRGLVEKVRESEKKVENLWKFFGVNSLNSIKNTEAVAYRKRAGLDVKIEAIATWLRCGEIECKKIDVAEFSSKKVKKSLEELRSLTCTQPEEYSVEAKELLAKAGVCLVYVPHIPGAGVSGAVRWIGDHPLIQLSLLGKYADIFWFNLFHEIGHILLHSKKDKFIEFDKRELSTQQEKEREADTFAGDTLVPAKAYEGFVIYGDYSKKAVSSFAKEIEIDPGIVEGKLSHDKHIPWSKPLGFRERLQFTN